MTGRPTLTVVIAAWRTRTLPRALASIAAQEPPGPDVEVLVVGDREHPELQDVLEQARMAETWRYVECPEAGGWGYPKKQLGLESASGRYVAFLDDDDVYANGAFAAFRRAITAAPDRVHIFRIDRIGTLYWRLPDLRQGNVSSQGALVPNVPGRLGSMANSKKYAADYDFVAGSVALQGEPVWHEEVVVLSNVPDWLPWRRRRSTALTRRLDRIRDRARLRTRLRGRQAH